MRRVRLLRIARRRALALAAAVALVVLGPNAHAGSIGKTSFSKGGVTRTGSASFASGTRSAPRSKFGGSNGSRSASAFSRSMSSTPRGKFPAERGSRGESAFATGLRPTPQNTKFPEGDRGSDPEFSRSARSTPGRKFPGNDNRSGEDAFSDDTHTTPKDDFDTNNGGDPEFSDKASSAARRKFADGNLGPTDPEFSDDLKVSIQSRFPAGDGAKASGGGPGIERLRGGPRDFSRQRAPARTRAASSRSITVGPAPTTRVGTSPAPTYGRGMQRLPSLRSGRIPIVIGGRTHHSHRGIAVGGRGSDSSLVGESDR